MVFNVPNPGCATFCLIVIASVFLVFTNCAGAQSIGDNDEDDTVNLIAVGGYFTESQPRCVFPFYFNGKLHNGCLDTSKVLPYIGTNVLPGEAPEGTSDTTGGVLGWCPTNFERKTNQGTARIKPFDEYSVEDTKTRKHWGYCSCQNNYFWQRLDPQGKRLNSTCEIANRTTSLPKEQFHSIDCRNACDETKGCQGFEFIKLGRKNMCILHNCILSSESNVVDVFDLGNNDLNDVYKQQIKRPCEEAAVNFEGIPSIPIRNVTSSPTTLVPTGSNSTGSPTVSLTTVNPTAAPSIDIGGIVNISNITGSPVADITGTASPTISAPTTVNTTNSPSNDTVNPAAYAVPISLFALAGIAVFAFVPRHRGKTAEGPINKGVEKESPNDALCRA